MVGTGHHSRAVLCVAEQSPRDTVTVKGPGPSSAVRASRLPLSPVDHVADSWLPLTSRATVAVLQAPMGPSNVQSIGGNSVRAKEAVEVHPLAPSTRAVYNPGPAWLGAGVPAGRVQPVMVEPALGTALTRPVAPKQSCSGMADTTAVGRGRTSMSRVTVLPGQPPLSAVAWISPTSVTSMAVPGTSRPLTVHWMLAGWLALATTLTTSPSHRTTSGLGATLTVGEAWSVTVTSRVSVQVSKVPVTA